MNFWKITEAYLTSLQNVQILQERRILSCTTPTEVIMTESRNMKYLDRVTCAYIPIREVRPTCPTEYPRVFLEV